MSLLTSDEIGQLRDDGFAVLRGFLGESELSFLTQQHDSGPKSLLVGLIPREVSSRYEQRLQDVAGNVRDADIHVDRFEGALWFSTARGVNFGWHQDSDSYYTVQNHSNYLNVYVPVIKPERTKTGVAVVPFSALRAKAPDAYSALRGGGANRFRCTESATFVTDNERGGRWTLPFDIETIAVTPELEVGDALVMRGDMIHRTQDVTTKRLAASFRLAYSKDVIRKHQLCSGGFHKWVVMMSGPQHYESILSCFASRKADEVTVGELLDQLATSRESLIAFPLLQKELAARVAEFMSQLASLDTQHARSVMCDCERCAPARAWVAPILRQIERLSAAKACV
jgi:hypothetical protein